MYLYICIYLTLPGKQIKTEKKLSFKLYFHVFETERSHTKLINSLVGDVKYNDTIQGKLKKTVSWSTFNVKMATKILLGCQL